MSMKIKEFLRLRNSVFIFLCTQAVWAQAESNDLQRVISSYLDYGVIFREGEKEFGSTIGQELGEKLTISCAITDLDGDGSGEIWLGNSMSTNGKAGLNWSVFKKNIRTNSWEEEDNFFPSFRVDAIAVFNDLGGRKYLHCYYPNNASTGSISKIFYDSLEGFVKESVLSNTSYDDFLLSIQEKGGSNLDIRSLNSKEEMEIFFKTAPLLLVNSDSERAIKELGSRQYLTKKIANDGGDLSQESQAELEPKHERKPKAVEEEAPEPEQKLNHLFWIIAGVLLLGILALLLKTFRGKSTS